ncbi:MAG: hypothetical protein DMG97_01020 [Acidobacteria bacterium]|nr:MAG: hypothetical protein DMG96_24580 [Acidobacteriota bacterium]PYV77762.1 MAG: hypothetical protein DMG97_01020 [Acidobacteriota bacterium]
MAYVDASPAAMLPDSKGKHLLGDLHGNAEKPFAFAAQARDGSAVLFGPKLPVLQGIARDPRISSYGKANPSDHEAVCLRSLGAAPFTPRS